MNFKPLTILISIFLLIFSSFSYAQYKVLKITYHTQQSKDDKRFEYDISLLKLALEKTKKTHGDYLLVPLKMKVNYKRISNLDKLTNIENLVYKHSVTQERLEKHGYIHFPVDLGIVGYRIAFLSKEIKEKVKSINTLEELKNFSMLQGLGWLDVKILRQNGFKVIEGSSYSGLFGMVARNRADLFLRGANEIYNEWQTNKKIEKLTYDESFVIYYPLPRFFFTAKKNKKAINRISEGLKIAYKDGSLIKLWENHYKKSIEMTTLHKRKVFKLENPFIKNIDKEYEKYIYKP